jgi:MscS family membrane protein
MINIRALILSFFSALLLAYAFSQETFAQERQDQTASTAASAAQQVDKGPEDALGRGNPRGSIVGYLTKASELKFDQAAEYLDMRNLPSKVRAIGGTELARQLNHVISRAVWLDDYSVSDRAEGAKGDGLPDYRDLLLTIPLGDEQVPIWLQRVPRGDGEMIWKISNRSVARIPELYDEYSYSPPVERIRKWFPEDASFLGIEAFKWFIVVVVAILCWPAFYLLGWILARIFSSPRKESYPHVKRFFTGPMVLIGILVVIGEVIQDLGLSAYAQRMADAYTISTIAIVWALWALINIYRNFHQQRMVAQDRPGAAKLLRPLTALVKMAVLVFGLLFWLGNIGVNITTVLAGLGVGGLAVALALQKPIEDMMGALTIFSQMPMRVGDLVKYGEFLGVVEDIGLRTTRIRTLTNTVVSIPNSRVAYVELENLSYREKIRYWPTLRLRYDTPPEKIRRVSERILDMLQSSDRVYDEPIRVRLTDFAEDAILIKIHCFMKTTSFPESLEFSEDLNYQVMTILAEEEVQFALPGRSLYMEGDGVPVQT